jgi:glycine/D-amino acid oxidase-like deaminating enzyme
MADTFIPFAEETYARCEKQTGTGFYQRKEIIELLKDAGEINEWTNRSDLPGWAGLVSALPEVPHKEQLQLFPGSVRVQGGFLDTSCFMDSMHAYLEKACTILDEAVTAESVQEEPGYIVCNKRKASYVIFCEGYRGMSNPFWQALPWQASKGELMVVHCPELKAGEILTRKIFILPVGDDRYKVGSTYAWDYLNEIPTEEALEKLCVQLRKIIRVPFEVVSHQAAVRPTVKERRPFLGFHPTHNRVGIFNGLGTKGVMMGPWLANHFAEHLKNGTPLLPEVDIKRFATELNQATG